MATFNTKSIAQLIQDQAAAIQGKAAALVDFSAGSVLRALVESNAAVAVWLQGLILQLLALTRLATSSGADVDSFLADFGFSRITGTAATGSATFSRYTPTNSALVPVGALVQSADGTQQFSVIADTTNGAYSASLGGFLIPAGQSSLSCAIVAVNTGTATNIAVGAINTLLTSISGVDTVSNAAAFTGGAAAESDAAVKARFVLYILGLAKGTSYGIASALANTGLSPQYTVTELFNFAGTYAPGSFYVVADDGSGSPSGTFLNGITTAIQNARPLGIQASVFGPTMVAANVNMVLATATGFTHSAVVAAVATVITNNINALGLGNGLPFSLLYEWAYSVAGVTNVTGVTLNGASGDAAAIAASQKATIKAGTVTVA